MPFPVCRTVSLIILRFAGATGLHNACAYVDFSAAAELTHHIGLILSPFLQHEVNCDSCGLRIGRLEGLQHHRDGS